jgi:hypothetical protein
MLLGDRTAKDKSKIFPQRISKRMQNRNRQAADTITDLYERLPKSGILAAARPFLNGAG